MYLCSPFTALLIVHKLLAVRIIEKNTNFALFLISKIKPEFFDLNWGIIHVFSEIFHLNSCFNSCSHYLWINYLYTDGIIVTVNVELESFIVYWVFICLTGSFSDVNGNYSTINRSFYRKLDVWSLNSLWESSNFNYVHEALSLEILIIVLSTSLG